MCAKFNFDRAEKAFASRCGKFAMAKLAKQYDLPDVGLAKVCMKLGVPRPGRMHWVRVDSGRIPP